MSPKLLAAAALGIALAACASSPKRDLGRLGFMVGCWKSADGVNLEVWSPPEGGLMFGYATTTRNGALATFEVAAKHLSFTLAARELNITQGAVSQQHGCAAACGLDSRVHTGAASADYEDVSGKMQRVGRRGGCHCDPGQS